MAMNLSDISAPVDAPREKMSGRVLYWAIASALAGFLFGFDTVVISGAEQTIQRIWSLSPFAHGLVIGVALYGTVVGSIVGGWPTDRLGRRTTLILVGILYIISAIFTGLAWDVWSFGIARFLGGLGIGISTVVAPLYISEIAPAAHRGRLAALFQFNIVFGIVMAFVSNALLSGVGEHAWRWMLGVAAFPSIIYAVMCFGLPESPRWLLANRHDFAGAMKVLGLIDPQASVDELQQRTKAIMDNSPTPEKGATLSSALLRLRMPFLIAFFVAFFNQMSGINAVLYFAPRIFELSGLGAKAALLQSVGIGVVNIIFTFAGLWLIDRLGRRTLLYIGSVGYILSLGLCSYAFFAKLYSIVPTCIFVFIAAHAVGQGTVIWVLISEIFPNEFRAIGQSFGSATHWIFAALLTTFFPVLVSIFAPGAVFLFFCLMMILQVVWIALMVPETKGLSLEEIQRRLVKRPGDSQAPNSVRKFV